MNGMAAISELTSRIATLTSIARTSSDDRRRLEHHGGSVDEFNERVAATVADLRKTANALEKLAK